MTDMKEEIMAYLIVISLFALLFYINYTTKNEQSGFLGTCEGSWRKTQGEWRCVK